MDRDLERLAKAVRARRIELHLGVEPAAKLAGISKDTWKRVEAAAKVRETTYAAMEKALKWAPGSIARILAGEDAVTSEPAEGGGGGVQYSRVPKRDLERAVGDAVQSAAIATRGDLTADDILKLNRRVLEELRERGIL